VTVVIAAASGDAALVFIEIGTVALVLSVLARLSARVGITAIPLYLLAGLAVGEGGIAPLDVSADFIELAGEIGVLLLLLTLGLEYSADELRQGLRAGAVSGVVDAVANFTPGFLVGLALGWEPVTALLLGGVCWVSSSGVVSKVLRDLDRLGNRETPAVLNLLVIEDLAMAVYLPIAGALIAGRSAGGTIATIAIALTAVTLILTVALRSGRHLSALLAPATDEALLLAVFGLTLLVGGLAQKSRCRPPSARSWSGSRCPARSRNAPRLSSGRCATCSPPRSSSSSRSPSTPPTSSTYWPRQAPSPSLGSPASCCPAGWRRGARRALAVGCGQEPC
jgi:CPA2 family monovalent cation:H+ antiporter-2